MRPRLKAPVTFRSTTRLLTSRSARSEMKLYVRFRPLSRLRMAKIEGCHAILPGSHRLAPLKPPTRTYYPPRSPRIFPAAWSVVSAACADAQLEPPRFRFAGCGQILRRAACEARDRQSVKARALWSRPRPREDYSRSFDFLRFVVVVSEDDVWQWRGNEQIRSGSQRFSG